MKNKRNALRAEARQGPCRKKYKMFKDDADHSEHHGKSLPPGEGVQYIWPLPGHPRGLRIDALVRGEVGEIQ